MDAAEIIEGITNSIVDDGGMNYIHLIQGTSIINKIISFACSVIIVILIIGIPITIVFELLYLSNPLLREHFDLVEEKNSITKKIMGLCLRDAKTARIKANTVETGRSEYFAYLGIKSKNVLIAFFIIGMCLGPINLLIDYMVQQFTKLF